jgi:hypothetical protein
MPLFEEPTQQKPTENSETKQTPTKPNNLITTLGSLLPFAPLLFEQFTGQKIPPMSGTIAEMQLAITQIQTNLQTVVNNQNQIYQQIEQLKTTATQQFTNLTHQFNSLRLTHTKERKEIEYNPPKLEEQNY